MNILILVNGAPGYKYFFSAVGAELERSGHKVRFAADARRSATIEPDEFVDTRSDYFTEFFAARKEQFFQSAGAQVERGISEEGSWGDWFYSDFDRFFWYGTNLNKDTAYWIAVRRALCRFFEIQLDNSAIDCVVYENVSNSFAYAAYKAAEARDIPYIGLAAARIPGRFEIQTSIKNEAERIAEIYNTDREETADEAEWIDNYLANMRDIQPDYMQYNKLDTLGVSQKYLNSEKLRKVVRVVKAQIVNRGEHRWSYQYGSPLYMSWVMLRRSVGRRFRAPRIRRYFETLDPVCQYYVYPIHFHPESSTSILAPNFTDELNNIVNIAFSLPVGAMLYVKEHMSAYALQPAAFYRRVNQIPNVKLLRPGVDIKQLMAGSEGVITITGTPGFEALMLGKPVYCLGDAFYAELPGVSRLRSFTELADALKTRQPAPQTEEIRKTLLAYRRYTCEGTLNVTKLPDTQTVVNIVDLIVQQVRQARVPSDELLQHVTNRPQVSSFGQ